MSSQGVCNWNVNNEFNLDRSGDKCKDEIQLYLKSCFYDCTLKLTSSPKVFKCHKSILATDCVAFERMFVGFFQNLDKGRDDEIEISSTISPEAFDLVMKYIYGRLEDFQSIPIAAEIFKFAIEWQILHLIQAARHYLDYKSKPADNVILVYDLYKSMGVDYYNEKYNYEIIRTETSAVLNSKAWLEVSHDAVHSVCQEDQLAISEMGLFKALIKWGEAAAGSKDAATVRSKIDCCIKKIRFRVMPIEKISKLCIRTDIFTAEEKQNILTSINLDDKYLLPKNFSTSKFPRYLPNPKLYPLVSSILCGDTLDDCSQSLRVEFALSKKKYLLKVKLDSLSNIQNSDENVHMNCKIFLAGKSSQQCFGGGSFEGKCIDSAGYLTLKYPVLLQSNTFYVVQINFVKTNVLITKMFERKKSISSGDLKISLKHYNSAYVDVIGLYLADVDVSKM